MFLEVAKDFCIGNADQMLKNFIVALVENCKPILTGKFLATCAKFAILRYILKINSSMRTMKQHKV